MPDDSAITVAVRAIRCAAGVFAPGHLGELTQYLPFELADDVLEETRKVQRRLRDLRRRVGAAPLRALFDVVAGPVVLERSSQSAKACDPR